MCTHCTLCTSISMPFEALGFVPMLYLLMSRRLCKLAPVLFANLTIFVPLLSCCTVFSFPPDKGNVGTAAYLNVFGSIFRVLQVRRTDPYGKYTASVVLYNCSAAIWCSACAQLRSLCGRRAQTSA